MIAAVLAHDVNANVQDRGRIYYRRGLVRILKGSDDEVRAMVRGSSVHNVFLNASPSDHSALELSCTCAQAHSGICKHIWATVLAADARGYLTRLKADTLRLADRKPATAPPTPAWEKRLAEIEHDRKLRSGTSPAWPERRQLIYTISELRGKQQIGLSIATRERKANGSGWNMARELRITRGDIQNLPDPDDQTILALIAGAPSGYGWSFSDHATVECAREIGHPLAGMVMPAMCRTGRCFYHLDTQSESLPLEWDESGPWRLELGIHLAGPNWTLDAVLRNREDREMPLRTPVFIIPGLMISRTADRAIAAALDAAVPLEWATALRRNGPILVRRTDGDALLERLLTSAGAPAIRVPEELRYEDVTLTPRPRLHIRNPQGGATHLEAALTFSYDGRIASEQSGADTFFDRQRRILLRRDKDAEGRARQMLRDLGARWDTPSYVNPEGSWRIPPKKLPPLVRTLLKEDWQVEAEGKLFRAAGNMRLEVSSGLDWFELRGEVEYDGAPVSLPELLAAVRRGEHVVQLGDGTFGMLPEEWLTRLNMLAGLGESGRDHIRFERRQAGLLDAMLATQEVRVDEGFAHARAQLKRFEGVKDAPQPAGFTGVLRGYQCDGLGWMHFLRQFGFGGCLADDMGVGKTAQVLALLEHRRAQREGSAPVLPGEDPPAAPSLAVVPRSLVFNWKQETARFTPRLRILDHTGSDRSIDRFGDYDLIVTTYGTLRRDIVALRDFQFDYVILDEAQAIKNHGTDAAKAARLLRARYRLAMSGTPVENHLGDLWSIFEFLNPGMLGSGTGFGLLASQSKVAGEEARAALSRALRPLILRRTKEQVASELPEKTEQTIFCEMKPAQQELYNELRDYYRASLLNRIETDGLEKSKMHVLEALLRLRQAACHPGLIDEKRGPEASAKIDLLLDRLTEICDEGHKALVFSQFTSLLSIVRTRLEQRGMPFAYLDGKTRDRQEVVERFQTDGNCPVFLISLKAGGVGLNLTSAEYVFLLDPWWNPAVEAQAIDRTHRIGQTRQVFAYRLIARGTVEEKVLELQQAKRDLAAAIISEDNRVLSNMRREDLEDLLS